MRFRTAFAGVALALTGLSAGLVVSPIHAAAPDQAVQAARHKCTKTSSGSCISGGQFCPQDSFGRSGWDAKGRRYVCKGDRTHPHWMKP